MATKTINVSELAEMLGTDGRTARKFLRKVTPTEEHPGKGGRWSIEGNAANLKRLRKAFEDYSATPEVENDDAPEVEAE